MKEFHIDLRKGAWSDFAREEKNAISEICEEIVGGASIRAKSFIFENTRSFTICWAVFEVVD